MSPSPQGSKVLSFTAAAATSAFAHRRGSALAHTSPAGGGPFPVFVPSSNGRRPVPATVIDPPTSTPLPQLSFQQRRWSGNGSPRRRTLMKLDDATEEFSSIRPKYPPEEFSSDADVGPHRRKVGGEGQSDSSQNDNASIPSPSTAINGSGASPSRPALRVDDVNSWFAGMSSESVALLNLVAIIWGTQHSVIKTVVDDCDPSAFSFARFGLGALLAARYTPPLGPVWRRWGWDGGNSSSSSVVGNKKEDDEEVGTPPPSNNGGQISKKEETDDDAVLAWRWGLEMGTWMFLGYAFQAIGLAFTTAQRSGFLLYLNVKFVPFFARVLFGRDISKATWVSAFTALAGTALLSYDGTDLSLNVGDLWSVAAAAASAMFILRLESASGAVKDSSALNAASLWVVAAASLVWTIGQGIASPPWPDLGTMETTQAMVNSVARTVASHPFALIYLGGVTTALANYIQTKAQKDISAERASIIYAMDPVYGAFFASVLLGESLNSYGVAGAGLITLAAATNAFLDFGGTGKVDRNENINGKT